MSERIDHPPHYGGADNPYEATPEISKACSACKIREHLPEFPPDLRRKDGRGSKCRTCAAAAQEAYYARYPEAEAKRRLTNAGYGQEWYRRNRDAQVARMRWSRILKLYRISQAEYDRLLIAQGGACVICRASEPGRGDDHFVIDHDHHTGEVRGLLCQRCNSGLGFFSDDPERMEAAAAYVRQHANR